MKIFTNFLNKKARMLYILASTFFLSNCSAPNKVLNCNEVKAIKFAYLPKGINPNKAISNCEDIFKYRPLLKDTTITNKKFVCEFFKLVKELKPSNQLAHRDFRIICLIAFSDNKEPLKICFGEGYLTVYNQNLMKDNHSLFDLLDEVLYPPR